MNHAPELEQPGFMCMHAVCMLDDLSITQDFKASFVFSLKFLIFIWLGMAVCLIPLRRVVPWHVPVPSLE